jgi:hypothetical protein
VRKALSEAHGYSILVGTIAIGPLASTSVFWPVLAAYLASLAVLVARWFRDPASKRVREVRNPHTGTVYVISPPFSKRSRAR